MRGGSNTGLEVVCNGCFTDNIYLSSEGSYGRLDYCYTCANTRCPGIEEYAKTKLLDHIDEAKKRQLEKDFA